MGQQIFAKPLQIQFFEERPMNNKNIRFSTFNQVYDVI